MVHLNFAVHPQLKFACFYALTVHVTVHGSGRSSHRPVRICLGIGRVAGSTVSSTILQLQNPKFLCFVADLFGVDAGMIV